MKLNESTSVPLIWLITSIVMTIGATATSVFWVKGVNDSMKSFDARLARIEKHMGLPPMAERPQGERNRPRTVQLEIAAQ